MTNKWFSHPPKDYSITFYGSGAVVKKINDVLSESQWNSLNPFLHLQKVSEFQPFSAGGYEVKPLPTTHDKRTGPFFYQISRGGKTMLYAHDTGSFADSVWDYFGKTKPRFDFISIDCNSGNSPDTGCHMALKEDIETKSRILESGFADGETIFVANHFSHNGGAATLFTTISS